MPNSRSSRSSSLKAFKIVPAIGGSRQSYAIGDHALDEKPHDGMRQFFEGAGGVHSAMIAQPCSLKALGSLTQPDPGILFVLAHVLFDHDGNEKFHRLEAHAVHLHRNGQHRPRAHS